MKNRIVSFFSLILFINYSCSSNDSNTEKTFLCCGENKFQSKNIDKLDQKAGKINVIKVFTPNDDAYNDCFQVENLNKYSFNSLTIYDLKDNILFTTENYGETNYFCGDNINSGTLKYKLVVENEQTFVEFGYVCLVKTVEDGKVFSAETECTFPFYDPIIF